MNVLEALIGVIPVQHAATLMGVTPVLATVDTLALAVLAHVSAAIYINPLTTNDEYSRH